MLPGVAIPDNDKARSLIKHRACRALPSFNSSRVNAWLVCWLFLGLDRVIADERADGATQGRVQPQRPSDEKGGRTITHPPTTAPHWASPNYVILNSDGILCVVFVRFLCNLAQKNRILHRSFRFVKALEHLWNWLWASLATGFQLFFDRNSIEIQLKFKCNVEPSRRPNKSTTLTTLAPVALVDHCETVSQEHSGSTLVSQRKLGKVGGKS